MMKQKAVDGFPVNTPFSSSSLYREGRCQDTRDTANQCGTTIAAAAFCSQSSQASEPDLESATRRSGDLSRLVNPAQVYQLQNKAEVCPDSPELLQRQNEMFTFKLCERVTQIIFFPPNMFSLIF